MCGLARGLFARNLEAEMTASVQWLERTLDDSAPRRDYIAQAFIGADEVLNLAMAVMENPAVFPKMIEKNLARELPFMITENLMMDAVTLGGDRQILHEKIRQYSQEAGRRIKEEGKDNELLQMLADDPAFGVNLVQLKEKMTTELKNLVGRAPSQVVEFYKTEIKPILEAEKDSLEIKSDVKV
jgi:adenylosuccinate lyase